MTLVSSWASAILAYTGTLNYNEIFRQGPMNWLLTLPKTDWALITVICICLFIGAMGKSAQFPLHVWLPDSMEGPTPISALIHAATMVTAGIFMVARMSPLFEVVRCGAELHLGHRSITALFMGFLGIIQNDIKRVVAYSTCLTAGLHDCGVGRVRLQRGVFHLMTHAFFKALLFLGAGSVIIGMHHDQDIRNMGGLWKYMKITWITSLLGSLALIGTRSSRASTRRIRSLRRCMPATLPFANLLSSRCWHWCVRDGFLQLPDVFPGLPRQGNFHHKPFPGEHDHRR